MSWVSCAPLLSPWSYRWSALALQTVAAVRGSLVRLKILPISLPDLAEATEIYGNSLFTLVWTNKQWWAWGCYESLDWSLWPVTRCAPPGLHNKTVVTLGSPVLCCLLRSCGRRGQHLYSLINIADCTAPTLPLGNVTTKLGFSIVSHS